MLAIAGQNHVYRNRKISGVQNSSTENDASTAQACPTRTIADRGRRSGKESQNGRAVLHGLHDFGPRQSSHIRVRWLHEIAVMSGLD
jgi:hypothetical protein